MKRIDTKNNKASCCGCGACKSICPRNAIELVSDENGFPYPIIDESKCVDCGLCSSVCDFAAGNQIGRAPLEVWAASHKIAEETKKSSSGAIFPALAKYVLDQKGVVYGAAYIGGEEKLKLQHIKVDSESDLYRLRGSKYLQSDIGHSYIDAKTDLENGKMVLFSGTPCQIAGLKSYLRKEYQNLYTIDIVCHGVPSQKHFDSFIDFLEERQKDKIVDFSFRAKEKGWTDFYIRVKTFEGKIIYSFARNHAYYDYFLKAMIYRENCYVCPYACDHRVGDITIGDFWGIEKEHAELKDTWMNAFKNGTSCILVNSDAGKMLLDYIEDQLLLASSTYDKAAKENGQLKKPSSKSEKREEILKIWREEGYSSIQKKYQKSLGMNYYKLKFKKRLALIIKPILKK